jgi:phospholipid transport system substrate-binding protein
MTRLFVPVLAAFALAAAAAPPARAADPAPAAAPPAAATVPGPAPQELIETTARKLLGALDADREQAHKDPARVRKLVDEILLPHFDTDYSARLVLGKNWRDASPEQRKRFIDAFYQSLLKNYGSSLAEFTADRMKVLPFRGDLSTGQAVVRTEVKRSSGQTVPVNYTLRATPAGWKAWDVTIEGISYVRNFRNDVGAEIEQKGIDSVIQRLETENAAGAPPKKAG